jgi:hypothetical protein
MRNHTSLLQIDHKTLPHGECLNWTWGFHQCNTQKLNRCKSLSFVRIMHSRTFVTGLSFLIQYQLSLENFIACPQIKILFISSLLRSMVKINWRIKARHWSYLEGITCLCFFVKIKNSLFAFLNQIKRVDLINESLNHLKNLLLSSYLTLTWSKTD